MGRVSETIALAFAMAASIVLGVVAAPAPTVKGDPQAWAEIQAAFAKLDTLKTYRMRTTMRAGVLTTMEFVHPDRMRSTSEANGVILSETISVGNEVRFRWFGRRWVCHPFSLGQLPSIPNRKPESGGVIAARGPVETIDGIRTQTYTYSQKTLLATVHVKLFVAIGNGLLRRTISMFDRMPTDPITSDYYDYNVPITITLPACQ